MIYERQRSRSTLLPTSVTINSINKSEACKWTQITFKADRLFGLHTN